MLKAKVILKKDKTPQKESQYIKTKEKKRNTEEKIYRHKSQQRKKKKKGPK